MEVEANRNDERILELEGEISKNEDDLKDVDTKFNEFGIHIPNIDVYVEGEHLVKKNQYLWDQISQSFLRKLD